MQVLGAPWPYISSAIAVGLALGPAGIPTDMVWLAQPVNDDNAVRD